MNFFRICSLPLIVVFVCDFAGVVTTPQLHYFVWSHNSKSSHASTEEGYYRKISDSLAKFLELSKKSQSSNHQVSVAQLIYMVHIGEVSGL